MSQLVSVASGYGATQYDTKIPSLGDAASIVEAFKLYHYGIDNFDGSVSPAANSIESHLVNLKSIVDQKISISSASSTYATFAYAVGAASSASANADTRALIYATSASANANSIASATYLTQVTASATYLTISGTQNATNKTFTSPVINSGSATSLFINSSSATNLSIISASTMGDQEIEQFLIRNLYISTASPSAGSNGDVWIRYV